jgi:hypothetical protein
VARVDYGWNQEGTEGVWGLGICVDTVDAKEGAAARFLDLQALDKHGSFLLSFSFPKTNQHRGGTVAL